MQQDFHTFLVYKELTRIWLLVSTNLNMMNDSSKHHSQFLTLIFILNCLSKPPLLDIEIDQGIYYYLREFTSACIIALTTLEMILTVKKRN